MRKQGFTLLEILIVVGIIALLAAFVVPNLIRAGEGAKTDMALAAINTNGPIATALGTYRIAMGTLPRELKELGEPPADDAQKRWRGPYVDTTRLKDPWGEDYQYAFPSKHQLETSADHSFDTRVADTFDLWSKGPDRQDGTEDDIINWQKQ